MQFFSPNFDEFFLIAGKHLLAAYCINDDIQP